MSKIKKPGYTRLDWRWREALAAGEAPVLPGRRSRSVFRNEKHRPQLDSLTQGKLLPCSPPKKKPEKIRLLFLEVERIELSSSANATSMTTCLVPFY